MSCGCETITVGRSTLVTRRNPDCRTHGLPVGYAALPHLRRHAKPGEDDRTVEERLYRDAMNSRFDYLWWWRSKLPDRKGQPCRVLARGKMNSVLVEFSDGYRAITSRYAVRRRTT